MVFNIIFTIIVLIAFISLMYGTFEGVRRKDDKLTILCSIGAGLIGMILGVCLCSMLMQYNI
jgi:hypothetical protein